MEIKPGKRGALRGLANVTFESADELHDFGFAAPLLSLARQREMRYFMRGAWPGPSFPESFPAEISVPESVLARAAGNLMLYGGGVRLERKERRITMIDEMTRYFTKSYSRRES